MTKKIVWLVVSCLMVLSLVIASCGTTETGGTVTTVGEGQTVSVGAEEEEEELEEPGLATSAGKEIDKPQYGGKLTILTSAAPSTWNPGAVIGQSAEQGGIVLEQILGRDWEKGLAGTAEYNFVGGVPEWGAVGGNLAESWEIPDIGVWILHIREGVHFGYNSESEASKLVGGREMTAEDVAYSIEYMRDNPNSATNMSEPTLIQACTIDRIDEWTIQVNTPVSPTTGYLWIMGGGGVQYVWPKEHLENYADNNEWYNTVGTGAFVTDDYVVDSAVKYVRNDNYWGVNPCGPGEGDQLPYIQTINYQVIPDQSTRLAALRTGKADWSYVDVLNTEEYDSMIRTNPEMESVQVISDPQKIHGRVDLDTDPFSNKLVREAMMLAVDHPSIVNDFYDGQAEYLDSPARKWYPSIYTPLEELPEETQALYGYDLELAKQKMADAGYPDGFRKTLNIVNNASSEEAAAILKDYLEDINIILDIQPLESGIWMNMFWQHTTEDWMLSTWGGGTGAFFVRYSMGYFRGPNVFNMSHVDDPLGNDPVIEQAYEDQCKYVMIDYAKADEVTKEAYAYCVEQAFFIPMPASYTYRIWQPWLKNYYGEGDVKFWLQWAWIDEDLKTEILNQ